MTHVLIETQALIWFAQDASILSKRAVSLVDSR
jgi:PIN domain nuclease of toxin-antitoxin system